MKEEAEKGREEGRRDGKGKEEEEERGREKRSYLEVFVILMKGNYDTFESKS